MANISVEYLVVAGGGAGGTNGGGGGGAGGLLTGTTGLVSGIDYAVIVGAGGATSAQPGASGQNSSLAYGPSVYFNGTTDSLTIPHNTALNLAGVSWTIQCWVNPTGNYTTYNTLWAKRGGATQQTAYEGFLNTGNGYIGYYNGGTIYTSTTTLTANTWSHCVWQCIGTTIKIYVNGTQVYTTTIAANVDYSQPLVIGGYQNAAGSIQDYTYGYISDFHLVKAGTYYPDTATITVPTQPLSPTFAGCQLSTCNSRTFSDKSANNFTVTPQGSVGYSAQGPFYIANPKGGGGGAGRDGGGGGVTGGSGGGGADAAAAAQAAAGGGTAGQGFGGGAGTVGSGAGGGGGAGATGTAASAGTNGAGGAGVSNSITGTAVFYAGGGGGARCPGLGTGGAAGGNGGGGAGASAGGTSGTANTGGGGGGNGGLGGSGVVIVRYLTSNVANATGGTTTTDGLYTVRTFTSSGTLNLVQYTAGMPINTVSPTISGTINIGSVFTCTRGTWTGNATITYTYQWLRDGSAITGATSSTYTTVSGDAWRTIGCIVTATNSVANNFSTTNSILLNVATGTFVDTILGFAPKSTAFVVAGADITIAEPRELSLSTTANRVVNDDYTNLAKSTPLIVAGKDITVSEPVAVLLTTTANRIVNDDYTNLAKLQTAVATTYAYTDGVPITSIGGGGNGSSSPANTETWFMG